MKTGLWVGTGGKAAWVAVFASILFAGGPAEAASVGKVAKPAESRIAEAASVKDTETTSSVETAPAEPGCQRPRKRLWVEGEGWIVRRVTVCY